MAAIRNSHSGRKCLTVGRIIMCRLRRLLETGETGHFNPHSAHPNLPLPSDSGSDDPGEAVQGDQKRRRRGDQVTTTTPERYSHQA